MSERQRVIDTCDGGDLVVAQQAVADFLAANDGTAATAFAANRAAEMAARLGLRENRLAILASFTIDPLEPHLALREFLAGRRLHFTTIAYEQWYGALTGSGAAATIDADVVFLLLHLEDVAPLLGRRHLAASTELDAEADRLIGAIDEAIRAFRARCTAPLVLFTFVAAERGVERYFDRRLEPSRQRRIDELNARLSELAATGTNVFVLDYAQTVTDFGRRGWFDRVKGHHVKASVAARALPALASELSDFLTALSEPRKKVVVVDLDNTLWDGIVGEDGPDGIAAAGDYPGNAFADFQAFLANLRATGVMLAVASRNNRADAEEAFRRNPDMPLKWEDFSAHRIDWADKAANLRALAEELNVGADSILFVDDSPLECDLVRTYAPEVTVVHAAGSPSEFPERVLAAGGLYAVALTDEDRRRATSYRAQRTRAALVTATDTQGFLAELGLRLTLRPPDEAAA
ncbi:MAG: HAD-IIIC family phosphatase, partial [Alphaproteobacteria bacterium]|nr:HAD-IIIC family phosphatase [Alphaproteobacteria bacterium]